MKKWAKILSCGLLCAVALTGCATVGNLTNNNPELIYNGTSAVMVEGHLYYGNALVADVSTLKTEDDYNSSAASSYLSRLNTTGRVENADNGSAKNVEKVDGEVVGGKQNFMFVLGQDIYYATPNTQKGEDAEGNTGNYYNYTSIYRTNLNGDRKTKLYTTSSEVSTIEALKFENRYYIVMLSGERLLKIDLQDGKAYELATGVKSVAVPKTYQKDKVGSTLDWNGQIYFTTSAEEGSSLHDALKRVNVANGEVKTILYNGDSISFIGRERDVVFYTQSNETFFADVNQNNFVGQLFYPSSSVTNISAVVSTGASTSTRLEGYVCMAGSNLAYVKTNGAHGTITLDGISSYSVLFVSGKLAYLATSGGIYEVDLSSIFNNGSTTAAYKTIVTSANSKIQTSAYAYDREYIYFYAKLEEAGEEATDGEICYMFRARIDGTSESAQLISQRV